jgi:hypothetical protein
MDVVGVVVGLLVEIDVKLRIFEHNMMGLSSFPDCYGNSPFGFKNESLIIIYD